ncbi:MAG: hypothetical protein RLY86_1328 [Pseudomonadota bacterium]|jgi:hypothetical protein
MRATTFAFASLLASGLTATAAFAATNEGLGEQSAVINIEAKVLSYCSIAPAVQTAEFDMPRDGDPDIELGTLTYGCNGPFKVSVEGDNGYLLHKDAPNWRFNYSLVKPNGDRLGNSQQKFAGGTFDEAGLINFLSANIGPRDVDLNINFFASNAAAGTSETTNRDMVAGLYKETLTFTITPDPMY